MRVGLFGGSFDPIHLGHLIIAQEAAWQLRLSKVLFIPAAQPPHKPAGSLTAHHHRMEMVRRAIEGVPEFAVGDVEAEGGPRYTVDTLRWAARTLGPETDLFLLVGADSLVDMTNWMSPEEIGRLATVAVYARTGSPLESVGREHVVVDGPLIPISASEIRERWSTGRPVRYWVPEVVRRYAGTHGLYARDAAP